MHVTNKPYTNSLAHAVDQLQAHICIAYSVHKYVSNIDIDTGIIMVDGSVIYTLIYREPRIQTLL